MRCLRTVSGHSAIHSAASRVVSKLEGCRAHQLSLHIRAGGLSLLRVSQVLSTGGERPLFVQLIGYPPVEGDIFRQRNERSGYGAHGREQPLRGGLVARKTVDFPSAARPAYIADDQMLRGGVLIVDELPAILRE